MKNKILFAARYPEALVIKNTIPQPAINFVPKWFNNIPTHTNRHNTIIKLGTARTCPSFSETFKDGYIIPAPCDIYLRVNKEKSWEWQTANNKISLTIHEDDTLLDYLPPKSNIKKVFKLHYPFNIFTSKGISTRVMPVFWEFNKDFTVPHGQFHTDKVHQLNLQILYTSDKEEIVIKQGTPLAHLIPFKRNKFNYKIINQTNKYLKKHNDYLYKVTNKFRGGWYNNIED